MRIREWNEKYSSISNKYNAMYHSVAVKYGFSDTQYWILYILYNFHGKKSYTQYEVADEWGTPKQTVNSAIVKLTKDGYLQLIKRSGSRNSKTVELTEQGLTLCEKCIRPLMDAEERALMKFSEEEHVAMSAQSNQLKNIVGHVASSAVIASYLFSTKRTQYAIPLNAYRSVVFNSLCINGLLIIFGSHFVWHTVAISEAICLCVAIVLWRVSERNGIIYNNVVHRRSL